MMIKKILITGVVVISFFVYSCGSLIVPAIHAAHAARIKKTKPAAQEKTVEKNRAEVDGEVVFDTAEEKTGEINPEIVTVLSYASYDNDRAFSTISEIDVETGKEIAETQIQPVGDDGLLLSVQESGVIDESTDGELLKVSAKIERKNEIMLQEPSGIDEVSIKSDTAVEAVVKKLIVKAKIKKPKKIFVIHPQGDIENLVLLWNPRSREALVINALDKQNKIYAPAVKFMKHFMMDHKHDEEKDIDPQLVKLLYEMAASFDSVLYVTSGYRKTGGGTKPTSYHTKGMAADIRHPRVSGCDLRDFAVAWGAGGVGFYPKTNSVHVDVRKKPYYWVGTGGKGKKGKVITDMDGYWANHFR